MMYMLVKLGSFHIMVMNGLEAAGYIMPGSGFRRASGGNLCDKHYSTHHVWPVIRLYTQGHHSHLCSHQPPHCHRRLHLDSPI